MTQIQTQATSMGALFVMSNPAMQSSNDNNWRIAGYDTMGSMTIEGDTLYWDTSAPVGADHIAGVAFDENNRIRAVLFWSDENDAEITLYTAGKFHLQPRDIFVPTVSAVDFILNYCRAPLTEGLKSLLAKNIVTA